MVVSRENSQSLSPTPILRVIDQTVLGTHVAELFALEQGQSQSTNAVSCSSRSNAGTAALELQNGAIWLNNSIFWI